MKPKLILLSDLWGKENSGWMELYMPELDNHFHVTLYDSRELAGISSDGLPEAEIHQAFVNGGIEKATAELLKLSKKRVLVLGLSMGGTIAWKAALGGMPVIKLVAISATRLRKEYQKPKCEIELFYGEKDEFRPTDEWFEAMDIYPTIQIGKDHNMYKSPKFIRTICEELSQSVDD